MQKIITKIFLLIIILFSSLISYSLELVCSPHLQQAQIDHYEIRGLPHSVTSARHIEKDPDNIQYCFRYNMQDIPIGGPYIIYAIACKSQDSSDCSGPSNKLMLFKKGENLAEPARGKLNTAISGGTVK